MRRLVGEEGCCGRVKSAVRTPENDFWGVEGAIAHRSTGKVDATVQDGFLMIFQYLDAFLRAWL